jgi:ribonucleoside-diphosphate reductase alpha chain
VLKLVTNSDLAASGAMMGICPDCSGVMNHAEGCLVCHSCGFSKCS